MIYLDNHSDMPDSDFLKIAPYFQTMSSKMNTFCE